MITKWSIWWLSIRRTSRLVLFFLAFFWLPIPELLAAQQAPAAGPAPAPAPGPAPAPAPAPALPDFFRGDSDGEKMIDDIIIRRLPNTLKYPFSLWPLSKHWALHGKDKESYLPPGPSEHAPLAPVRRIAKFKSRHDVRRKRSIIWY